ncbi:hypothetical protein [Spirosoma endbachense]|uniref:Uncharacterized protein n=1 Tax=Spirosoma endbachense TaxID=2666025 RepID=A0A6P1VXW8_9BACT|nr:hypothetical protein [Spirosoma endbachense]QHV97973.1 hypothetical protein GJR95_24485 [Spirosoma endbachense]
MKINPENHVSLNLAWQLKSLGFPQNNLVGFDMFDELTPISMDEKHGLTVDAPTVSELFEALPIPSSGHRVPVLYVGISRGFKAPTEPGEKYYCMVTNWKSFQANKMADAVAKAIVALVRKGSLVFNSDLKPAVDNGPLLY